MSRSSPHLALAELVACAEGKRLAPEEGDHAPACPDCSTRLAELERLIGDLRSPAPEPPSEAAVERCAALLRPGRAERPGRIERLARRIATPASGLPCPVAVRGAAAPADRLRFEEGGASIEVELAAGPRGGALTGLALPAAGGEPPLLAHIEKDGAMRAEVPVREHGLFRVEAVPAAPFDLVLEFADRRVRLRIGA